MKSWVKYFPVLAILVTVLNLVIFIYTNRESYTRRFNYPQVKADYLVSPYVLGSDKYQKIIEDDSLYSLAGFEYIRGGDPSAINFEHQPLVKYFYGASILIFGNSAVGALFIGLVFLGVLLILSKQILSPFLFAIPALIVSFDPIFKQQLLSSWLDLPTVTVLLIFSLIFVSSLTNAKLRPAAGVFLGVVSLSDSFFVGGLVLISAGVFLVLTGKIKLAAGYVKFAVSGLVTYLLGYTVYFLYHPPADLVWLHLQQIKLYRSYVPEYPKGEALRIIFSGKWRKWFDDFGLAVVPQWWLFWPLGTLSQLAIILPAIVKKTVNPHLAFLATWSLIWLISINLKLVFPRYLVLLYPIWSISMCLVAENLVSLLRRQLM